jgi:hypothetical protein
MVMANGSVLVAGGENGSNGGAVPTLEVLPKPPGATTVKLDFLQVRSDISALFYLLTFVFHNSAQIRTICTPF